MREREKDEFAKYCFEGGTTHVCAMKKTECRKILYAFEIVCTRQLAALEIVLVFLHALFP